MVHYLARLSWPEADRLLQQDAIALIPIGSLEQHGRHLPLDVDNVLCDSITDHVVRQAPDHLNLVVCPSIHYGYTMHNMDFPGTMTLRVETLVALGVDLCESLVHHGCRKIVFVSTHGSNFSVLDIVSRKVMCRHPEALVAVASPVKMAAAALEPLREATELGGMAHACELETSVLLYLRPDSVDMSRAERDIHQPPSAFYYRDILRGAKGVALADLTRHISKTGTVGNPEVATAEKGRQFMEVIAAQFIGFLEEFHLRKVEVQVDFPLRHPRPDLD